VAAHPGAVVRAAGRRYVLRRPALDPSTEPILVVGTEQLPSPDSRVLLSQERDPLGMPRTRLEWKIDERELAGCERFARITAAELKRLGLGDGTAAAEAFELPRDERLLSERVVDAGHHMGTTRMGESPRTGVVDDRCRFFGRPNLYVGSCSVFPTGGVANPTFTMLALCLRIADDLAELAR
jgi:choline dehydrogenase-like flavoprotein